MKKICLILGLVCLYPCLGMEVRSVSDSGTSSESKSDAELAELRHKIESIKVNDLGEEDKQQLWHGHAIQGNPLLIRRSIESYAQSYPESRKILFASGHKGRHEGSNYGFDNDMSWYAVDTGLEHEPDALLNIHNLEHLKYFGKNFADVIYVDWSVLVDEGGNDRLGNLGTLRAILKPGGALYFKRNSPDEGMSKSGALIRYSKNGFMSENGRYGYPLTKQNFELIQKMRGGWQYRKEREMAWEIKAPTEPDEIIVQKFGQEALKRARAYYKDFGFSNVEFYGGIDGFKLTKSDDGDRPTQREFNAMADKMTLQELADSPYKDLVAEYFDARERLLKTIPFPVLSKQWVEEHNNKPFPTGQLDVFPSREHQEWNTEGLYTIINGIKWKVLLSNSRSSNTTGFRLSDEELLSLPQEIEGVKKNCLAAGKNGGAFYQLVCRGEYGLGKQTLRLWIRGEFLGRRSLSLTQFGVVPDNPSTIPGQLTK